MVGCCAPGCSRRTEHGVRFFGYPKDPKRRKQWEIMTNRPLWTPTEHSKLCQYHFEDDMFKRKEPNWRLKPNGIPTLFLHNQYQIEDVMEDNTFSIPVTNDVGRIEVFQPESNPELAAHDHSYISLKKRNSSLKSKSSQNPPPVGHEVEIPAEVQGKIVVNFEDYQIIQTEPSEFISNETDVFTIDENADIIHHILTPSNETDHFDESDVVTTMELNCMEVNSETRCEVSGEEERASTKSGELDEELDADEESINIEGFSETKQNGDTEEEEEVIILESENESTPDFEEDVPPVECGPTVNVKTCDDLCFRLRVSVTSLQTALSKVTKERDNYKNKLRKEKRKTKGLEKQLMNQSVIPSFLQDDQLKYLQKGSHRGFAWSEETIKQANELKMACGTRGYIALLMHNFPLPGLSTLRSNKRKENDPSTPHNGEILETEEIEIHVP
uniref:52 kDa repressor of the inhibitor of the protein kinaselike [Latimeria chalumnae] n=2 Tax=Lepeophtheirus salmonis TaxID=72036 RepID=C1BST5_LEPSM|nr:THAP domain-containing protein 4 [Lepeophtheirus salmonis]